MTEKEVYLGDGLYASGEIDTIKLRAPQWEKGNNEVIYLEKEVFIALVMYANKVMKWKLANE